MSVLENTNDYLVCGFQEGTIVMDLIETGKGGMARVVEIFKEKFDTGVAVAVFRVTAVDDRGVTVSYRTKLIHVIYTGPNIPIMLKAKVTSYNAAFRSAFNVTMRIQTDDLTDLTEAALEHSLRASGGAHQPTSYDFTNKVTKASSAS